MMLHVYPNCTASLSIGSAHRATCTPAAMMNVSLDSLTIFVELETEIRIAITLVKTETSVGLYPVTREMVTSSGHEADENYWTNFCRLWSADGS
jgi:hypothetical protein